MSNFFDPFIDPSIKDTNVRPTYHRVTVDVTIPYQATTQTFLTTAIARYKVQWIGLILVLGLGLLLARLSYLQVLKGNTYLSLADNNRIRIQYQAAARGIIYDSTGQALVVNEPNFIVTATPSQMPDSRSDAYQQTINQLAQTLQLNPTEVSDKISQQAKTLFTQPVTLSDFVSHDDALRYISQLHTLAGVQVEAQAIRQYPSGEAMAPITGYVGKLSQADLTADTNNTYLLSDSIGKTGLESIFEQQLRGVKGKTEVEITASGKATAIIAKDAALPGNNVVLSIDAKLQQELYDAILSYTTDHHLPGGAAVAVDPNTGFVKALVSVPSYDPNLFTHGISTDDYQTLLNDSRKPLFNKTISGEYPSGSTFKLIVASGALQEGVVTPQTTVMSTGGLTIGQARFPDWKIGGHGRTDIYKALAESVNTYFYLAGGGSYNPDTRQVTGGLGISRIDNYASLFGLGEVSGVNLPNETAGLVPSPAWKQAHGQDWYIGDTYHVSIGQGDLLVTPLQVAMYTSVVANGGTLYTPQLAERTTNQAGETVDSILPQVRRQGFVDANNLAVVRAGMRQAVLSGSARSLSSLPFTTGAKTGTAEIGETGKEHAWFTVFAPYENPQLVLTVLIEDGGEGVYAALPIAKQVLGDYLK